MWWLGLPDLPWVNPVSASFGSYTCILVHTCTIVPAEHYSKLLTLYQYSVPCIFTLCHQYSAHHCTKSTGWALQYNAYTVPCTPYLNLGFQKSSSAILRVDWVDQVGQPSELLFCTYLYFLCLIEYDWNKHGDDKSCWMGFYWFHSVS